MSKTFVVVGAGLPGIAASLALANAGREVVLIDSAPEIGGLLRSYEVDGFAFDYGTHFANRTGIADLDELLFGSIEGEWLEFPVLRAGNVWNGTINSISDNPDLNSLGPERHDRCLAELLAAPGWRGQREPDNAREFLTAEYGPALVAGFFDPVLKKFTGRFPESLHHRANLLFNLKRFAVLDASATRELKCSERFDGRVAYHHRDHFEGHRPCLYPSRGGIGRWIEQLERKLRSAGVRILTGARIERIVTSDGKVTELTVDGSSLPIVTLLWSVAPAIFSRMAGIELPSVRPAIRSTVLAGIECNRPFQSDCHYLTVFDPDFAAFRVTLYQNFRSNSDRRFGATIEFMVDPDEVRARDWPKLAEAELLRMGLINSDTKVLTRHEKIVVNGFPVLTNESVAALASQSSGVQRYSNVRLLGRAAGEGWFLDGLIRSAHEIALETAR